MRRQHRGDGRQCETQADGQLGSPQAARRWLGALLGV
jgi:hypothetical protein